MLRCLQVGLRPEDLRWLNYGQIIDILIERNNDGEQWNTLASQEDFDRF